MSEGTNESSEGCSEKSKEGPNGENKLKGSTVIEGTKRSSKGSKEVRRKYKKPKKLK